MKEMLRYFSDNFVLLSILLAVLILAAILWTLFILERRKLRKAQYMNKSRAAFTNFFSENHCCAFALIRKKDLRIVYLSPNFEAMFGLPADRVMADVEVLRNALDKQACRDLIRAFGSWPHQDAFETELHYIDGAGEKSHGKLLLEENGDAPYYFAVFMDTTKDYDIRMHMQEELEKAYRESQAKSDFLSKMSHEIRTPMNGILGMLSLAQIHMDNPKEAGDYLVKAESLSKFLLTLINDILDMSRIESGRMELEEAAFDLFAVADKLNSMFKSTVEDKGITWRLQMQDFTVRYVIGDELRLTQVIINFISNAQKFTPAGGTVSVTFRQMDYLDGKLHLMIQVKDTGKGIKSDFIGKIFRPFEQEDASTAKNYGGSGLGLAIANNIVKLMDGEIIVESEEGKGTEFKVYLALPVAEQDQTMPDQKAMSLETTEEAVRRAGEAATLEGLHILLAEDNDINAEIAIELLELEGVRIDRAGDGEEAVQMFLSSAPYEYDAILMDIQMPKMDGWEATKVIRSSGKEDADLLIFAMSANAFVEDNRHSFEVGMNGHISKPVDFDEVRRVIGEQLYIRSLNRR